MRHLFSSLLKSEERKKKQSEQNSEETIEDLLAKQFSAIHMIACRRINI